MLRARKTQTTGKRLLGGLRNIESYVICVHHAVALYMFMRFTLKGQGFPPLTSEKWYKLAMFAGSDALTNVGGNQMGAYLKRVTICRWPP